MATNPHPKWTRALTHQRLAIIRQNLDKTDAEVARKLGVHRTAVHDLRRRYKIKKVHGAIQNTQRLLAQVRALKPRLTAKAAAQQLGVAVVTVNKYGKLAGYEFQPGSLPAVRHFYWRERLKSLPPLLTVAAVARELGVTYGHAALLCHRHKYRAKMRTGLHRTRVPVRHWVRRAHHERWLASLQPPKG